MLWPDDLRPSAIDWWLETHTLTHTSPLSRATQTIEFPGARWRVSLRFGHLLRGEMERLSSFLNGLRGPAGRVTLWPMQQTSLLAQEKKSAQALFGNPNARSLIAQPWVNMKDGNQLRPDGLHAVEQGAATLNFGVSPVFGPDYNARTFPPGYFFSVNGELKQIVSSARVTPFKIRAEITPPMRTRIPGARARNEIVRAEMDRPTATFRLADDNQGRAGYRAGGRSVP